MLKIIIHMMAGVVLISCATRDGIKDYPYLPDRNSEDARLFSDQCGACHAPPHPARHRFSEWKQIMVMMEERMVERHYALPDIKIKQQILSYLQKHARHD